jgi:hypothetical protein
MNLKFELGNQEEPKGHAIVYFRDSVELERVYATYVVVFPMPINMAKYVPPFLASTIGGAPMQEISSFPMPPVPEEIESYDVIFRMATSRSDDLIFGGNISIQDIGNFMQLVGEITEVYTELWNATKPKEAVSSSNLIPELETTEQEGTDVNEVMFSLYSLADRLSELSKMMVRMRFASECEDYQVQIDTELEMKKLAKFLPDNYNLALLIESSKDASRTGTKLAQLHLERCYSLSAGDHDNANTLEAEIAALETPK